ncbi:MAG: glycosyltransferase family 2 protein [Leptolyngbyaceae bacterium]|nr:glycosyltransferase family 2 protein [Leptolyngbyaceae bacterium]
MKLSVVIPVYNEIHTIDTVLGKVAQVMPHIPKELVLVDDGSKDGTREWLVNTFGDPTHAPVTCDLPLDHPLFTPKDPDAFLLQESRGAVAIAAPVCVKVIFHQQNQGKGAALRTGFQEASGDVIVIQDADLEYDPQDWRTMWKLIDEGKADVVYGSRFYGNPHRVLYFHHLLGNKVISAFIDLTCNTTLTDIEVCYKMFRREVLDGIVLTCNDFGFEVEFTMKVTRSPRKWRIYETGISYYGRSYDEGKKINWKDGVKALGYIIRFWLWR